MNSKLLMPTFVFPDLDRVDPLSIDLLSRLNRYGLWYSSLNSKNSKKIAVVAGTSDATKIKNLNFEHLDLRIIKLRRFKFFTFYKFLKKTVSSDSITPSILIAGDPFRGLLACRMLQIHKNISISTQVSLHGEIGLNGFGLSFKNRSRNFIFKILVKGVKSVRLVLEDQIPNTVSFFKVPREHIFVAPIPIILDFANFTDRKFNRTIGFVGRLHQDRGLDLWIETIKALKSSPTMFNLKIIGDGPLRDLFRNELQKLDVPYEFLGRLTQVELKKQWPEISVLLSTAPTESYGMAMREAVLQGCSVVSFDNSGGRDALMSFPDSVALFKDAKIGADLLSAALNRKNDFKKVELYRVNFTKIQKQNIVKLVSSWT